MGRSDEPAQAAAGAETANESHEDVAGTLQQFIEETFLVCFDEAGLDEGSNLFDAGVIDSYGMIETVNFIESRFGVKLSDEDILSPLLSSVNGMATLIGNRRSGST